MSTRTCLIFLKSSRPLALGKTHCHCPVGEHGARICSSFRAVASRRYRLAIATLALIASWPGITKAGNVTTVDFVEHADGSPGFSYTLTSQAPSPHSSTFTSSSEFVELSGGSYNIATQNTFDVIISLTEPGDPSMISDQIVLYGTIARANGHGDISFQSDDGSDPSSIFRSPGFDSEVGNTFISLPEDHLGAGFGLDDFVYNFTNPFEVQIGVRSFEETTSVPEPSNLVMSSILSGIFGVLWSYRRLRTQSREPAMTTWN